MSYFFFRYSVLVQKEFQPHLAKTENHRNSMIVETTEYIQNDNFLSCVPTKNSFSHFKKCDVSLEANFPQSPGKVIFQF